MRAESGFLKGLNPTVAIVSKTLVVVFVLFAALMTDTASQTFNAIRDAIILSLSWYYIAIVAGFLGFVLWLMFSRFGNLRLGDDDERPEFGYLSWFAMLFAAGMGIGLVFWGVAEPMYHFQGNPFVAEGGTQAAAQVAMRLTYFHWGLHPWAIYIVVGLGLSYFCYCRKLPLAIRSALYPVLGERIYGPWGHCADILAVFGTVFGVATSLGLGVKQMNTGFNQLIGMEVSLTNQLLLIAVITTIATLSVVSGVTRGIKLLSELNLWLSVAILVFLFVFGPTRYLLHSLLQSVGDYVAHVVPLSLWSNAGAAAGQAPGWLGSWTVFYWGWWISWAPFVGMFIARISRGRTVREFVVGVLIVPTLLTFVWLTLFGGTALNIELFGGGGIAEAVKEDVTIALYTTLDRLDAGWLGVAAAAVATTLIATYFITSSDSGTLVVNTLLAAGDPEPPVLHRVIWGVSEGVVAATLLTLGGLAALQTASIAAALPFSIIMLFMCYCLVKALREDAGTAAVVEHPAE